MDEDVTDDAVGSESLFSGYSGRVFLAIAVGWLGLRLGRGVVAPLLPTVIDRLAITPFLAGVALTAMTVLKAVCQFLGGLFPAVALVAGVGGAALGFGAVGVALAAVGVTWAVIAVVGTAIVTRLAPPAVRGEALGTYTALAAVAGGAGGLVGGWTAGFGYLVAFGVAGGLVCLGAALVASVRAVSLPAV